ncbi:unnamed protein product [Sphagnum troendelagicum]
MGQTGKKRWLPLEANPEVMNQFVQGLGFPGDAGFFDVYGFDDDLLAMVPTPVLAVLLLFPISPEFYEQEWETLQVSEKVYFLKQTVGNACGTIGLLHAIGNNLSQLELAEGSYLQRFFKSTASMSPLERATFLENDTELEGAHSLAASAGDTPPDSTASVDLHFVCFVCVDGGLYEMDGRKQQPVYHGSTSQDSLLEDSVKAIQDFVARNPQSVEFNVIALAKAVV